MANQPIVPTPTVLTMDNQPVARTRPGEQSAGPPLKEVQSCAAWSDRDNTPGEHACESAEFLPRRVCRIKV